METPVTHPTSVQLAWGTKPGTPVPTTVLNRTFVLSPPRLDQRHLGIIDYLTEFVPRVLLVARAKGKRGMDAIAIHIVDVQSSTTRVKGGLDPFRTMVVIP
jgi:hypothetical protein